MRNFRFRLYPTKEQESKLRNSLGVSRWSYNYFVSKGNLPIRDMQFMLTELKEEEAWLRNYHSKMLQMVVHKIDSNRKVLNALRMNGYKIGKMNFIGEEDYNSFTYSQSGFRIERHGNTDLLWLSKIGYIKIRLHRHPTNIKQITIVRRINKWYALICCEIAKPIFRFINPKKSVGMDVGITKFLHDSNNSTIDNPLFVKKMLKSLRRAQRRLSRRHKYSKNRLKAKTRLQILHERIRNKRLDFLHKVSTRYSKNYDVIFLERLRVSSMVKNYHLARNIIDSDWSTFKNILAYKTKLVIKVPSNNTSVNCSKCGNKVPKSLAVRIHKCNVSNLMIDRDYNASLNIKKKGLLLLLPQGLWEATPVEILSESVKQEQNIVQRIVVHYRSIEETV